MTPQEITQIKAISLSAAVGNLEQAKLIFAWLVEDNITAEVGRLVEQAIRNKAASIIARVTSEE